MDEEKLDPRLQLQLDEVEKQAAKEARFDPKRGLVMGLICFGLFFTAGVGLRAALPQALGFGLVGGIVGFVYAAFFMALFSIATAS